MTKGSQDTTRKASSLKKAWSESEAVHLVVQRYRSCKILIDETDWISVGTSHKANDDSVPSHCGMLVYVSFANTADKAAVYQAARTTLNLAVLTIGHWGDGISETVSLSQLAAQGPGLASLVLVPQANLISKVPYKQTNEQTNK
jgi:hypothetical protein